MINTRDMPNISEGHQNQDSTLAAGKLCPIICGVGTATSLVSYSQEELLDYFKVKDRRIRSLFLNSAIGRRHLVLPPLDSAGFPSFETQGDLVNKHRICCLEVGAQAIRACLKNANAQIADICYLCCTTTTGFLTPGLTALLCRDLLLREDCVRLDVVGMGCNAGLNALNATAAWAHANPGKLALMLCVEICSAAYVFDGTMRTAVVNSLFGDGAAAVAITAKSEINSVGPKILKFNSLIVTEAIEAMRFDWDDSQGKFSFFLDPDIPYVIGANVEKTINALLLDTDLRRSEISHWIVHSGGKKVIDALRVNLGLSAYDLRHTSSVLKDYGNLSSGSFLFSYQRLINEAKVANGDYGIMISMGPGSTIESALINW